LVKFDFSFIIYLFCCLIEDNDDSRRSTVFLSGDVEPGTKRGGLAGEFLV
jgi:hypothetical protein